MDLKADVVDRVALVPLGRDHEILHPQHRVPRPGRLLYDLQLDRASYHHIGQGLLVRILGLHGPDVLSLAQHGDTICHGHDLVELMGDEEDGFPLLGKLPHGGHQLVNLLGREHRRGLVEDEDLVVPIKHLQNLHPLLHPHRDVLHLGVQVHLQAVPLRQGLHLCAGRLFLQKPHSGGLRAQDDVIQYGEYLDEFEMLVYHADTQGGGVVGIVDLHNLAVFLNGPRLRLI